MRSLIFILTLLIGFQPAGWAMASYTPSTQIEALQNIPRLQAQNSSTAEFEHQLQHELKLNLSKVNHNGCPGMRDATSNSIAADCFANCPACCISTVFLDLKPGLIYQANASFVIYQPPSLYSFVSLTAPPEIHPPRASI